MITTQQPQTFPIPGELHPQNNIRLYSGRYVNPLRLTVDDIDLVDIAHGLSNRCRFNGQCKRFYSVAAHSLRVAELVPRELRLQALLHDASEAYLFDMPAPLKVFFPALVQLEHHVMHTIALRFGFPWPMEYGVRVADEIALEEEWSGLMTEDGNLTMFRQDKITIRNLFIRTVEAEL